MKKEISDILRVRFPVLDRLLVQESKGAIPESLPSYVGIFLSVMNAAVLKQPVCFVLPRRGDIARLAAVIQAVYHLAQNFPQWATEYAKMTFKKGQRVRVKPSGHVYIFDDVGSAGEIWLLTLESTWGRRIFPVDEILRLEPTSRKRPIGRLETILRNPPPALLDRLIGTKTYGNQALIRNEVLILDSRGEFSSFVARVVVQSNPPMADMVCLDELLSFGDVRQPEKSGDSWFDKWERLNPAGDPILGLTYSPETLANYCIDAPAQTKLVIVNGISQFQNHLQAYDDMAQTQKLVLFADQDELEMIQALHERGCSFWWFGESEFFANDGVPTKGILSSISRWASNQNKFVFGEAVCNDSWLEESHKILHKLSRDFLQAEDNPLSRLVPFCWKVLGEARGVFQVAGDEQKRQMQERLKSFKKEIERSGMWIPPDSKKALEEFVSFLSISYEPDQRLGEAKGKVLADTVRQSLDAGKKTAVITRSERRVDDLRQWLRGKKFPNDIRVYSCSIFPSGEYFDHLIFVSWPGAYEMRRIVAQFSTPNITLVGYPFECQWLKQFYSRIRQNPAVKMVTAEEKSTFVAGRADAFKWDDQKIEKPLDKTSDEDVWILEYRLRAARIGLAARPTDASDTVPAQYVRFSGELYAFLTESHKLPVATGLLSQQNEKEQSIPEVTVEEMKPGDFVVFPDSGDRELIQELADRMIGPGAKKFRDLARLWKLALQQSGLTPEQFHAEALRLKHSRHLLTIRNWFVKTSQIGPKDKDDLTLIACVTNDKKLIDLADDVQRAIDKLRSAHLSAGMYLRNVLVQRLPEVIGRLQEGETSVDIGELGSARIAQIEHIDDKTEPRGRYEVNRLLSE